MAQCVLWQFQHSHYNEKARWALDFKRIPHRRHTLVAGLHIEPVTALTGQTSVPVLVLEDQPITGSAAIIDYLERTHPEPPLYPYEPATRARALELQSFLDRELGPYVRRALFHELLKNREYAIEILTAGADDRLRAVFARMFPRIADAMRAMMNINDESAAAARRQISAVMDKLESEFGPAGYLAGNEFSVADLTAAALLSPLAFPAEFPYPLPEPSPEELVLLRDTFAARPASRWVHEIYRRHRGVSAAIATS